MHTYAYSYFNFADHDDDDDEYGRVFFRLPFAPSFAQQ